MLECRVATTGKLRTASEKQGVGNAEKLRASP